VRLLPPSHQANWRPMHFLNAGRICSHVRALIEFSCFFGSSTSCLYSNVYRGQAFGILALYPFYHASLR
jgi:hypothetical protein